MYLLIINYNYYGVDVLKCANDFACTMYAVCTCIMHAYPCVSMYIYLLEVTKQQEVYECDKQVGYMTSVHKSLYFQQISCRAHAALQLLYMHACACECVLSWLYMYVCTHHHMCMCVLWLSSIEPMHVVVQYMLAVYM